jgi:GT2 family glycosyltransferase
VHYYATDIVIVNYNTQNLLVECLYSIKISSGNPEDYRVWIIDNGSTDGSIALIKKNRWVAGIFNRNNRGYGAACNQGILAGNGKYVFLLNSDIKVTPNWLPPLLKTLETVPNAAVVGPKLINTQGFIVGAGVVGTNAHPIIRGWGEPNHKNIYNRPTECLSVGGACMGIKRGLISELGLFDEHYFHYFEETDYCYNARFHGYKIIYCPDSLVIHRVLGSCRNFNRLDGYYRKAQQYFVTKWRNYLNDKTEYGLTESGVKF